MSAVRETIGDARLLESLDFDPACHAWDLDCGAPLTWLIRFRQTCGCNVTSLVCSAHARKVLDLDDADPKWVCKHCFSQIWLLEVRRLP